ncbi:glycosyltransferase [Lacticigenium naphthae]|uniref:glycosyltransferase n=1 Tax=Lacticigenium naphthae TaxID=515351 RepID=UPI0004061C0B|nr:glycosyltransferase [Lacticigenium naphthae]
MINILVYGISTEIGGIESFFLNFLEHTKNDCFNFDFILSSKNDVQYKQTLDETNSNIIKVTPWGENPLKHGKEVKKIVQGKKYDYIWVNTTSASNISIFKISKKYSNAKLIIHSHGAAFESRNKGMKYYLLKLLDKINKTRISHYGDILFASSNDAALWLFDTVKNVHIIYNGIESSKYLYNRVERNQMKKELNLENKEILLTMGRLEEVKNHEFLIDIMPELIKHNKNRQLLILGQGSLENVLKTKVRELGLQDHIFFLGFKEKIENYLEIADLFLLPSKSEGLSIATIEAQASGLQCVVSNAVPSEVKVTDSVYRKDISSPDEWIGVIEYLLDKEVDRIEMNTIVKDSDFDISKTVSVLRTVLKEGGNNAK